MFFVSYLTVERPHHTFLNIIPLYFYGMTMALMKPFQYIWRLWKKYIEQIN